MNVLIADDEKFMREDLQKAVERVRPGNSYFFAEINKIKYALYKFK